MNDSSLYYSVGALLYCPANNETVANSIVSQKFGTLYSLALCLEDTIRDDCVAKAEKTLIDNICYLYKCSNEKEFYMPKIFIRVRNALQMRTLYKSLGNCAKIITGFIIPKFSPENAYGYIQEIIRINSKSEKPVYVMPIYESASIVDLRRRYDILYTLKEQLSAIENLVLNIRVGGNDLCHLFGFRRHDTESIHQIKPVDTIFSDIITAYGMDYVISGPVWEYYNGANWKQGLIDEILGDKLCGFVGKTVIHPNQIEVVNEAYKVTKKDYDDACAILNWNPNSNTLVSASADSERMNEQKTHTNWAKRTLLIAEHFGIKDI